MGIAGRNDAAQGPVASGTLEVHALGWGFEANVGEMKSQLEKDGMERKVHVTLNDVARFDRRHRCTHYERADSGYALHSTSRWTRRNSHSSSPRSRSRYAATGASP